MKTLMTALATCVLLGSLSQSASAGGSSSAKVRCYNVNGANVTDVLAIIVDPPADAFTNANSFAARNGKYVFSGKNASISVSAGTHTVQAAYITAPYTVGPTRSVTVTVGKDKTVNVWVAGNSGAAPQIAVNGG